MTSKETSYHDAVDCAQISDVQAVPVLLFYDGVCGFCNSWVQWLIARDRFDRFRFSPQQSPLAERVLSRHGIDRATLITDNSVYLAVGLNSPQERILRKSDVTVYCLLTLGGFWKFLGGIFQCIPRSLRDAGYTIAAKNRYRISGKYDVCPMPSPEQRAKFVGI